MGGGHPARPLCPGPSYTLWKARKLIPSRFCPKPVPLCPSFVVMPPAATLAKFFPRVGEGEIPVGGQAIRAGEGQRPYLSIMNYSPDPPPSPLENQTAFSGTGHLPPHSPGHLCHPLGPISRVICSFVLLLPAAEHTSMLAVTQRWDVPSMCPFGTLLASCRLLVSLHGGMGYIALCAVSFSIRALVPFMRVPLS